MSELNPIFERHQGREGALLPILHDVMAEFGVISDDAIDAIAAHLGQTRAEIYGVVSFYHDFHTTPQGEHRLQICRAEACQSVGANALVRDVLEAFGLEDFGTTKDGKVTIEAVYCLGLCPISPAAMVDGKPMGRANVTKLKGALS